MTDNQSRFWDDFIKRDVSFLSKAHDKKSFFSELFKDCRDFIEPARGGNVLEIGCGDGMDSIALALEYNCRVTAIDLSSKRVELAISNIKRFGLEDRVTVMSGDAQSTEFGDGEFDLVVGNSVMLFLDHDAVCREISRVLRKDGRFLLSSESLDMSPLVRLSRRLNLGYRSRELERHVSARIFPPKIQEIGKTYFSRIYYKVHFGFLMQIVWGLKMMSDRIAGVFGKLDTYNKPHISCPALIKRLDIFLVNKFKFYRDRTWIVVFCFIK